MTLAIEAEELAKRFGTTPALRGIVWVPESRSWVLSCEFVGEAIGPR
jgi:hypothetical protein